jgi:hypothetical protein
VGAALQLRPPPYLQTICHSGIKRGILFGKQAAEEL